MLAAIVCRLFPVQKPKTRHPQWWRICMGMKPIDNWPHSSIEEIRRANCDSGVHRGCGCEFEAAMKRVVEKNRELYQRLR